MHITDQVRRLIDMPVLTFEPSDAEAILDRVNLSLRLNSADIADWDDDDKDTLTDEFYKYMDDAGQIILDDLEDPNDADQRYLAMESFAGDAFNKVLESSYAKWVTS